MKWKKSLMAVALAGCMIASSIPTMALATDNASIVAQEVKANATLGTGFYALVSDPDTTYYLSNDDVDLTHRTELYIEVQAHKLSNIVAKLDNESVASFSDTQDVYTTQPTQVGTNREFYELTVYAKQGGTIAGDVTVTLTGTDDDTGKTVDISYKIKVTAPTYLEKNGIKGENKTIIFNGTGGQEIEPELTLTPADLTQELPIVYESKQPSIVEVRNNKLYAVGKGTAEIVGTCEIEDASGNPREETVHFTVTVTDGAQTSDLRVVEAGTLLDALNPGNTHKLYINNTFALNAQYWNGRNYAGDGVTKRYTVMNDVTWSSSNTNVAVVSNTGIVTAVGAGTTSISAETTDGLRASFRIDVEAQAVAATSVDFDQTSITVKQGQRNLDLGLVTNPADATVYNLTLPKYDGVTSPETEQDVTINGVPVTFTLDATMDQNNKPIRVGTAAAGTKGEGITLAEILDDGNNVIGYSVSVDKDATLGDYVILAKATWNNPYVNGYGEFAWDPNESTSIAECKIKVEAPDPSAVTSFELQRYYTGAGLGAVTQKTLYTNTTVPVINPQTIDPANTNPNDLNSYAGYGIADRMVIEPAALADSVKYSIDNTDVAKIVETNAGAQVVALKPGSAVLTATIGDKTDTIKLDVVDPLERWQLNEARIDNARVGLDIGDSQIVAVQLRMNSTVWQNLNTIKQNISTEYNRLANIPGQTVDNAPLGKQEYVEVWSSANEKVAKVDAFGKITAVGAGTTTVTATVGSLTASTVVTVVDPNAKPEDQKPGDTDQKPAPARNFTDVKEGDWFYDAVYDIVDADWMDGTSATTFSPYVKLNRAAAVQILWAKNGKPATSTTDKYTDVPANEWYAQAVAWATAKGIVEGRTSTTFAPTADVTRQEFALMLWKEEGEPKAAEGASLDKFKDKDAVADWATKAMTWAVGEGILTGYEGDYIRPTWNSERGQAAQMFSHLLPADDAK